MAPETFYFFFSIILVLIAALHISHMLYFRSTGKTFSGEVLKPGMPGYKKINNLASAPGLIIAVFLVLIFTANLVYAFNRVSQIDTSDARFLLVFAPIITILLFLGTFLTTRKKFGNKQSGKHD